MIYLDHHAATPPSDAARRAIDDVYAHGFGNPASVHTAGRNARAFVERARAEVASALSASAHDIVFTSGGTEACNLAVQGLFAQDPCRHVITSAIEHPAIAEAVARLEHRGTRVTRLAVPRGTPFAPDELRAQLENDTDLVALQWVNHETGTILPLRAYADVLSERGIPLVVDACQGVGKLPCALAELGASAVAFAASKLGGALGAGALWVERCRDVAPLLAGGAQERGRRPGTPDVASIAGFGAAAKGLSDRLLDMPRISGLRDRLERACVSLGGVVNGAESERVGTVTNLSFRGWRGDVLVAALDVEGLCASSGAACSSGLGAPSPVLRAMYPDEPWRAESALRLSLGPSTTEAEVEAALTTLERVLSRARRA